MSEDGFLEEDIWEYKSITKHKLIGQYSGIIATYIPEAKVGKDKSQQNGSRNSRKASKEKEVPKKTKQKPRKKVSQTPLKPDHHFSVSSVDHTKPSEVGSPASAKNTKICKKQTPVKVRPVYEGHCPSCQMPFSLLLNQTPQWHITECLDGSETAEKECPDGDFCTSIIPSHYKRYSHFHIAASRAQESVFKFSLPGTEHNFIEPEATSYNEFSYRVLQDVMISQSVGESEKSLRLSNQSSRSRDSINVANNIASPLENVKQPEQTMWNTNVSESNFSDNDISYSPLYTDDENIETDVMNKEILESETAVTKIIYKKSLFDIGSLENKSQTGSLENKNRAAFNRPLNVSEQKVFQDNGAKVIEDWITDNESSAILSTSMDEMAKPFSQNNAYGNAYSSSSILDQLKHSTDNFSLRRDEKELDQLKMSSSNLNPNDSREGSYNESYCISADATVKIRLFSSDSEKEDLQPLLPGQKLNSSLNIKDKTVNTCRNRMVYNNSYSTMEKELFCNSMAMPISPSRISRTQQHTSAANSEIQTTPVKQLKQMDIGVFFGLQPKTKIESTPRKNHVEEKKIMNLSTTSGKKRITQKRKAKDPMEDSDVITENSSIKYAIPAERASSGQSWQKKRDRKSCPTAEETRRKQCPFYKRIPGTDFVVDAFQYGEIEGCKGYFLTHFHSDHYGGLNKKFTFPIYCNKITGNLVKNKLGVQEQYVHILPMEKECIINGIKVVLLDANHCPGAAMILFAFPNGNVILHTGDFRADPSMERCPFLSGRKIHTVYLDTTYCSPEYTFPSQQEVIQFAVSTAFERVSFNPRTLIVCGTYSIGKEKVFLAIAEVLGSKVSMSQEKYKTLQCLESADINSLITLNWNNTSLHLLPMMQINFKNLYNHLNKFSENFDHILAFKPTGWTYSGGCCSLSDIQPQTRGKITIYGIPYSEHSSFLEIKRFIQWLKPQKIVPTVNVGNWKARHEMANYFRDWKMEVAGWN